MEDSHCFLSKFIRKKVGAAAVGGNCIVFFVNSSEKRCMRVVKLKNKKYGARRGVGREPRRCGWDFLREGMCILHVISYWRVGLAASGAMHIFKTGGSHCAPYENY